MSYPVKIEGLENQRVEAAVSFWSGPKLLVNGEPALRGLKRGELLLQREDGRQVTATWKPQALGFDVPQLLVDGKVVQVVEPLRWYQVAWSGWTVALLFTGGALGAFAGLVAAVINTRIFRTGLPGVLKYLVTGAVSVVAIVVYFVAARAFLMLLNQ